MPVIEVKLYDSRVTEESVPKMIEALTNALHESCGAAKERIHVIIQGVPASHWVLLDYGSVIVHIFTPPERDYYGLEKHWSEARTILRVQ